MRKTLVLKFDWANKTASWTSNPIDLGAFKTATIFINVTSLTGTTPTLDVTIEQLPTLLGEGADYQPDTANPVTLDEANQSLEGLGAGIFEQWTATGVKKSTIFDFGEYIRFVFTLGGVVTDCDVTLTIIAKS